MAAIGATTSAAVEISVAVENCLRGIVEEDPYRIQDAQALAIAWLIARGIRRVGCCNASRGWRRRRADLVKALEGLVVFEERDDLYGLHALNDSLTMYAADAAEELRPLWAEHRETGAHSVQLGKELGYCTPVEIRGLDLSKAWVLNLWVRTHPERLRDNRGADLWREFVAIEDETWARNVSHQHAVRGAGEALAEIGLRLHTYFCPAAKALSQK